MKIPGYMGSLDENPRGTPTSELVAIPLRIPI